MAQENCPHCGGTGWKTVERDGGRMAVRCECSAGDRKLRVFERARIPKRYEHCDFDNFETDLQHDSQEVGAWNRSLEQAREVVRAFSREFPMGTDHGLLLMGPCGVGKTHLAVATLKEVVRRGLDGLFCDYNDLLKQIQHSYNPESQTTEMDVLDPALTTPLLVLDDLGASKPSAWALETVGHILNTRYNNKRHTLLTTNYLDSGGPGPAAKGSGARVHTFPGGQTVRSGDETLTERIGQRIRSRLHEMCRTIEIFSPDYRREIHQTRHTPR